MTCRAEEMRLRGSHRATRAQFSFCYTGVWKGAEHSLSKGIYWHETGPVPVTFEKQIIHIMQKRILSCYYARFFMFDAVFPRLLLAPDQGVARISSHSQQTDHGEIVAHGASRSSIFVSSAFLR